MTQFFALILGLMIIGVAANHRSLPRPEIHELLVPPQNLKIFTLGYDEVFADSLWLRVVQDFDTCGHEQSEKVSAIPLDVVNAIGYQRTGRCENSWVYKMIEGITELAPKFRVAYSSGGVILSVAVDDVVGAARIYDKAAARFPDDWQLLYKAAYHYLYEMGDKRKAADLLIQAGNNGAPYWVPMLAARLYSKSGSARLGKIVMDEFIDKNPDKAENPHIKQRMAEIERDLAAGDDEPTPAPESGAQATKPTKLPKKKQ